MKVEYKMPKISEELIKRLIESYFTEADSPEDFSMPGGTDNVSSMSASTSTDGASTDDSTDSIDSATDEFSSQDTPDFDANFGPSSPGGGLNISLGNEGPEDNENQEQGVDNSAPTYRVLGATFDDEDDLNTKVRIQDKKTGRVSTVDLTDLII